MALKGSSCVQVSFHFRRHTALAILLVFYQTTVHWTIKRLLNGTFKRRVMDPFIVLFNILIELVDCKQVGFIVNEKTACVVLTAGDGCLLQPLLAAVTKCLPSKDVP